jgi:phage terminase large subunit-like protein
LIFTGEIMPLKTRRAITRDDREKLLLIAAEMKVRGIPVPEVPVEALSKQSLSWPIDERGYFIKRDGTHYNPTEQQADYISSRCRFALFYGGRGSGKSSASAQKALRKIAQGHTGIVVNPDFENFRLSTWPELKEWIPWDMVVPSHRNRQSEAWQPTQPFVMAFVNGARMYCKGLKDPESARGPNVNWMWYDESGRDETGMAFKLAIAGVRIGDNPQVFCSQTAKPRSHWSYKFFIEKEVTAEVKKAFEEAGTTSEDFIQSFHGSTQANKDNLDPGFYASLLATYPAGALREREIDGKFSDDGGKIGDSTTLRIINEIPDDWELGRQVRYWDMAGTEKKVGNDPDEAVGSLVQDIPSFKEPGGIILDQVAGWWSWDKLKKVIVETALKDGPEVTIIIEQEPGSGGKNQVAEIQSWFKSHPDYPELAYYKVEPQRPTDRVQEALVWFGYAHAGNVYVKYNPYWNDTLMEQVDGFTLMKHDDRVTSVSGAFRWLSPARMRQWKRVDFIGI